ncbi:unnamed protein product, partial [Brachionus calyciflorus]
SENKISWRCNENYCKAKCSTVGCEIGKEYVVTFKDKIESEHPNHVQINSLLDIKEKSRKIKESTETISKIVPNVAPRQILASFANEINNKKSIAQMPSYDAERKALNQ